MEVQVKLELTDLMAVTRYVQSTNRPKLVWIVLFVIALLASMIPGWCVVTWLAVQAGENHLLVQVSFLLGLGMTVFLLLVVAGFQKLVLLGIYTKRMRQLPDAPWRITITPEGVTVLGATFRTFNHWLHYQDVVQSKGYYFLVVSVYEAVPIPRRCFASDDEFRAFGEQCRAYFYDAQNLTPATLPSTVHLPKVKQRRSTEITDEPPPA